MNDPMLIPALIIAICLIAEIRYERKWRKERRELEQVRIAERQKWERQVGIR